MSARKRTALAAVAGLLLAVRLHAVTVEEVGGELVCLCGCGLVLTNCSHKDCGFALPALKLIGERLAAGETKDQIVASFVAEYGEVVLAAPTKKGFNLTVWILPFVSIAAGALVVGLLVRRWVRRRQSTIRGVRRRAGAAVRDAAVSPGAGPSDAEYEEIFARELERFE